MKNKFYLADKKVLKNIGKDFIDTKDIFAVTDNKEEMQAKVADYLYHNYPKISTPLNLEDIYQAISSVVILEQREDLQPMSPIVHPIEWYFIQTAGLSVNSAIALGKLDCREVIAAYDKGIYGHGECLRQLCSLSILPDSEDVNMNEYCFLGGSFEERLQTYCNYLMEKHPADDVIIGEIEVKNDEIIVEADALDEAYIKWEFIEEQSDTITDYSGVIRFKRKVQNTLKNYYFTFGNNLQFPYQDEYLIVKADNPYQAINLFRACYPDRIEGIMNCSFFRTEEEWQSFEKEPVEIIELKRTFKK